MKLECQIGAKESLLLEEMVASIPTVPHEERIIKCKLMVGELFPSMTGMKRLGYADPYTLQHNPGEVLLIVMGDDRSSMRKAFNKVHEFFDQHPPYEDKVRTVAVLL